MAHTLPDTRAPLVAPRKSSLHARNNVIHEHRKSRSSTFDEPGPFSTSFDAVILPNASTSKPLSFTPIATILRAHLPLSWLSGSSTYGIQPGTVLRAYVTTVSTWEYRVLIAKLDVSGTLFAFEKIDVDAYVCHPLRSWVNLQWVENAAIGAAPPIHLPILLEAQQENNHSRKPSITSIVNTAETPTANSPKIPKNRRGHLARLSILETKEKTEEPMSIADEDISPKILEREDCNIHQEDMQEAIPGPVNRLDPSLDVVALASQGGAEPSADVIHPSDAGASDETVRAVDHLSSERLRGQYLETLYLSKTSLAFYAKGPLGRARARARVPNAARTPVDLVDFYKECVISTKKLDLKYKGSLLGKISIFASGVEEQVGDAHKKSRKSKRTKLGKDGLWPLEDDYINRWWRSQDVKPVLQRESAGQSAEVKRAISHLRTRETEMHILLILEILALEDRDVPKQVNATWATTTTTSEVKVESVEALDDSLVSKTPAAKKPRDLKAELEFLIDRLCIWQSIGFEDTTDATDAAQTPDPSSQRMKDRLHDFCKDVIVPFYGAKLPQQCHAICTKLGGADFSPNKPKKASGKGPNKATPGAAIHQEQCPNKRKHQAIVGKGPNPAPPAVLSRSATLPTPVNTKRDTSERPMSRGGMQKSVSFSNREVDLVADARATAAKRRKLDLVAAQKRELDAAIETLKRPNRSMVAKSFMDDMERRASDTRPAVKKVEPVQISATPRRGGTRRVPTDEYDLPPMPSGPTAQEASLIPSSTTKPRGLSFVSGNSRSSAMKKAVLSAIHDTPSRAMAKTGSSDMGSFDGSVERQQSRVVASSSTIVASTPTGSRVRDDLNIDVVGTPLRMKKSLKAVLFTPVKRSDVNIERAFKDAPVIPERAGKMMDRVMGSKTDIGDMSLYQSLGWDDDYDL